MQLGHSVSTSTLQVAKGGDILLDRVVFIVISVCPKVLTFFVVMSVGEGGDVQCKHVMEMKDPGLCCFFGFCRFWSCLREMYSAHARWK